MSKGLLRILRRVCGVARVSRLVALHYDCAGELENLVHQQHAARQVGNVGRAALLELAAWQHVQTELQHGRQ